MEVAPPLPAGATETKLTGICCTSSIACTVVGGSTERLTGPASVLMERCE